jgi:3D (Asp-Asp-Asp) domain-containing protein
MMRIIRLILAALALAIIMLPGRSMAASAQGSNETKINFKIEDNIKIEQGVLVAVNNNQLPPFNFAGFETVKTPREKQIEKMLEKYAKKIEGASYPEGKFTLNASAYTAAADECGKNDGITASGLKVKESETIACPPQFPLGTKIKIYGLGTYMCQDRGGAIKGNHVDIYMETKAQAFSFGRRNFEAEVVM